MSDPAPLVVDCRETGIADIAEVGGKAASLGELTRAGVPVPPAYVVTTAAFRRALDACDPDGALRGRIEQLDADDHAAIGRATAELRDRLGQAELPTELRTAIGERYRALGEAGETTEANPPVAVRSSATSEDSAGASFAGVQDTFLWVRGEQRVAERVCQCWASLYSVESVAYRRRLALPEANLGMAVVVQRMVDARTAGVMFTRSPTTGDPSVIALECAWGLGSAVVSGEVTPDSYVVSKVTGEVVKRTIATKPRQHRMAASGADVVDAEVPAEQQTQPSVGDDELASLVALARRVEQHYGVAQDIEFAIARDTPPGEGVFVLQSRPETVWGDVRRQQPAAVPKPRPYDHVLDYLTRGGQSRHGERG